MNKWVIAGCIGCVVLLLLVTGTVLGGVLLFRMLPPQSEVTTLLPSLMGEEIPQAATPTLSARSTLPVAKASPPVDLFGAYQLEDGLSDLYRQVEPGVVAIKTYVQMGGMVGGGSGSGFILDEEGHIVTNEHVVADATRVIVVFFDGYEMEATILGTDADSDLAVLKVDELPDNVHPLPLGDSDTVMPGQWVVAIGNPFGLQNTMTLGIVSAVGRMIPARVGAFSIPQAIQTDAAINPGNSGGPLLNLAGQVIGVNAQIVSGGGTPANAGVGFALPVNIVRRVAPVLMRGEKYPWPWLGISGTAVDLFIAEGNGLSVQRGAYIAEVVPGGPAEKAGLRGSVGVARVMGIAVPVGGDVIIAVNGEPVLDFADLLETVAFSEPGDTLDLTVLRDGREIHVSVTLEERPGRQSF